MANEKVNLILDIDFWETCGSSSLKGLLFNLHPDIKKGDQVSIVFIETSNGWRRSNGGPRTLLAPEFQPRSLCEDILWLNSNFKLTLETRAMTP